MTLLRRLSSRIGVKSSSEQGSLRLALSVRGLTAAQGRAFRLMVNAGLETAHKFGLAPNANDFDFWSPPEGSLGDRKSPLRKF